MVKLLMLFHSVVFCFILKCNPATTYNHLVIDCSDAKVRDSLVALYIEKGALKYDYNTRDWESRIDSLISICPNVAISYQLKAIPYLKYGDLFTAFSLVDKAVELDSKNWLAYRGFLKCIFAKDYTGAISDFSKVQLLVPNGGIMDHSYFFYLGLCYLELGDFEKALENFHAEINYQNPTGGDLGDNVHFNTLFYTGVVFYELKNYVKALEYLKACISKYNYHPDANYFLALVYKHKHNVELMNKHLQISRSAITHKYSINEDNVVYMNYPKQVSLAEIDSLLNILKHQQ